jgi:hypothetical protein
MSREIPLDSGVGALFASPSGMKPLTWIACSVVILSCGGRYADESVDRSDALTQPGPLDSEPSASSPIVDPAASDQPLPAVGSSGSVVLPAEASPVAANCDLSLPSTRAAYEPPLSCATPEAGLLSMAHDAQELQRLLPGKWLVCSFPSAFGTDDELGIEITTDGSWYKLYPDGHGGDRRGTGEGQHGTTEQLDDGGYMQVNFSTSTLTYIILPVFSSVPMKMLLDNYGVFRATYVKNDASGRCAAGLEPRSTGGPYTLPAACAQASTANTPPDGADTARALLAGRWLSCEGSTFATTDDVGLDLTADGHFYKIYVDAAGNPYRGQGFNREGTYDLVAPGDSVFLELHVAGSGTVITLPTFGSNPRSVLLSNEGLWGGRYVFSEP